MLCYVIIHRWYERTYRDPSGKNAHMHALIYTHTHTRTHTHTHTHTRTRTRTRTYSLTRSQHHNVASKSTSPQKLTGFWT